MHAFMPGASAARTVPGKVLTRRGSRPSAVRLFRQLTLVGAFALSAVLMLIWLGHPPLWFDETVSVGAARLPTGALVHYLARTETNMSLYHALLHLWLQLGSGEAFARLLSALFGLATLPFVYGLARRLFDTRTAVIAVVLIAGNVEFVGHAREARGYSLAVLLVTASSWLLLRALDSGRRGDWSLFAVVGALAVYAHFLAVLAILAQLGSLVFRRPVQSRRILGTTAVLAVLLAPLAAALLSHWQGGQIDWVTRPHARSLPGLPLWFAGNRPALAIYCIGGLAALGAAVADRRKAGASQHAWRWALLLAWAAAPPLVAFAVSYAKPVYLYRYFLVCLPALVVLVAAGLARIRPLWIAVPVVAAGAFASTWSTVSCTPACVIGHDDWRAAAAYVATRVRPGDGVIFDPGELRTAFDYYLPAARRPRLVYPSRWLLEGGPVIGASTPAEAAVRARSSKRIWLVSWWLPQGSLPSLLAHARGQPAVRDFAENVRVRLYGPPGR
jgi:mannosyltransferase